MACSTHTIVVEKKSIVGLTIVHMWNIWYFGVTSFYIKGFTHQD